ncbi:MAG: glycosyltransferase family 2 protein, partial [Myxococcota bacterium]
MKIVIPMAGRGSRFADVGVKTPKPLIDVRGKPMYAWATESLPLDRATGLVFICLEEHLSGLGLREDIAERFGGLDPVVIPLDHVTEGQACTVLTAREHIGDEGLMIFNADTFMKTSLGDHLARMEESVDGLFGVFRAPGDKWSFERTDDKGRVVETAEKKRISEWASTGLYHFTRGTDFVRHADAMIADDQRVNGEFYVAPVYNRMIDAGADIRIDVADEVWALGTPEDL